MKMNRDITIRTKRIKLRKMILVADFFMLLLFTQVTFASVLPEYQLSLTRAYNLTLSNETLNTLTLGDFYLEEPKGFTFDLNDDGFKDYFIIPSTDFCGTGGCPYTIINGKTNLRIGEIFGSPVFIFNQKVNDFDVLHTYSHSSAQSGSYSCFVYDSTEYILVSSVYLEGNSVDELFEKYKGVSMYDEKTAKRMNQEKVQTDNIVNKINR
ncbi:MAG: hypothetical protein KC733_06285 [Candidatus Omnitrophica bacterium]|nr:hypothetical protein [Candidatus Omnitrophota bacterium]